MFQIPLASAPSLYTPFYADPVQAGFPSPAQGYEQKGIDLNELMVSNPPATYFVRAQGDSMLDAGIHDGDMLVVDFSKQSKHGDIVIAKLDDNFTVKRLYKRRNAIRLCPENKAAAYEPIVPQEGQTLEIIGVVRWVIHQCQ
jgi:DNA polymerase V